MAIITDNTQDRLSEFLSLHPLLDLTNWPRKAIQLSSRGFQKRPNHVETVLTDFKKVRCTAHVKIEKWQNELLELWSNPLFFSSNTRFVLYRWVHVFVRSSPLMRSSSPFKLSEP